MKLMTKEIAGKLYKADQAFLADGEGRTSNEVIVKYFVPWGAAKWWIVSGTPLDALGDALNGGDVNLDDARDWHLFGFCTLGDALNAEHGYVLLSQLEEIEGPAGMKIERDLYYNGKGLEEVVAEVKREIAA